MSAYPTVHQGSPADDPYRWLEGNDNEVRAFVRAQNEHSRPFLDALAERAPLAAILQRLLHAPSRGCPFKRGERYFAWQNVGTNHDVLVSADSVSGLEDGRVLIDPNALSSDGKVAVSVASVNPDGTLVAYSIAEGGSDWHTIKVRDVETGEDLDDVIEWTKWNPPVWLPGGRAFSYWAYDAPTGAALLDTTDAGRLMAHTVGESTDRDQLLFQDLDRPQLFVHHGPYDDSWFVLSCSTGSSNGSNLWVRPFDEDEWTPLVESFDAHYDPVAIRDDLLFVHTDDGAPNYELVAFDLLTGVKRTILAERDDAVLEMVKLNSDTIIGVHSIDACHRVELFDLSGTSLRHIDLGDAVTVKEIQTSDDPEIFVTTTSFVDPCTRHIIGKDHQVTTLPTPGARAFDAATTRISARSADGTMVGAFLVQKEQASSPRPTLIWGYGGFNISMTPTFRAVLAAWVEAGGVLCVANLRGGGEYGSEWHDEGTKERKQNVFNDLYAIAEQLIESGVTTASQLALHGRSNGGLLAGAALTQRPDLWAAVLPGVGVLDMLRFHTFTIGWAWVRDFGNPDNPSERDYLLKYSPLHNVTEGTSYPPTLITTGDHDDRVVPAHSYKFAATLQRAQSGDSPILLSVDTRAGHGAGKPRDAQVAEFADQLAFAAHFTGLDLYPTL